MSTQESGKVNRITSMLIKRIIADRSNDIISAVIDFEYPGIGYSKILKVSRNNP